MPPVAGMKDDFFQHVKGIMEGKPKRFPGTAANTIVQRYHDSYRYSAAFKQICQDGMRNSKFRRYCGQSYEDAIRFATSKTGIGTTIQGRLIRLAFQLGLDIDMELSPSSVEEASDREDGLEAPDPEDEA